MLAFLNGGEEGRTLYNAFVTGQVCYEVYKKLTVSQADVLRVGFALCQFKAQGGYSHTLPLRVCATQ